MSYVALGVGLAGVAASAGTSIYGASQQPDEIGAHQLQSQFYDPTADPLLAALSMNAMTGIGAYDPSIYRGASPGQQLLANLGATGQVDRRRMKLFQASLAEGINNFDNLMTAYNARATGGQEDAKHELGVDKKALKDLDKFEDLVLANGYGSLQEFFDEEQAYRARQTQINEQFQPVADQMRQAILASQSRTAGYIQNLPDLLTGGANPFMKQLEEQALAAAQKTGANPYNFLETARATAINRALQLIGGEASLVNGQQAAAQAVMAARQQGGATSAQIGAAQAQMMAQQLNANAALQAQQANAYANAGQSVGVLGLIGADMYGNRGPATGNFYFGGGRGGGWDTGPEY